MTLYKLFGYNAEIQYKNTLLSKATFFTIITAALYITLPFFVANRCKGFWLQSYYFYEQPLVSFNYDYLVIAETDDPSISIICGEAPGLNKELMANEKHCIEIQVHEEDLDGNRRNDILQFKINLMIPNGRTLMSIFIILGVDFQLTDICPLQMQSLLIINKDFNGPPNNFMYQGDLSFLQISHLPCLHNVLDTKYNHTVFTPSNYSHINILDFIIANYLRREVISTVTPTYSRTQYGHTGNMNLNLFLRIPEIHIRYRPSLLQEFKWAWPQYLSLVFLFYHLFRSIKKFVFSHRLVMAWEEIPWKSRNE